jgi:hypothetical protein
MDRGLSPLEEANRVVKRSTATSRRWRGSGRRKREAIIGRVEMGYRTRARRRPRKPSSEAARKAAKRALVRLAREMDHTGE